MVAALGRAADRSTERSLPRLEAVFHLDTCTKSLRRNLTAQYIEHANRSSKIENQLWQALFDLTQSFLVVLQRVTPMSSPEHGQSSKWQAQLPRATSPARSSISGHDAKIRLLPLRAVDPGEVGRAPQPVHQCVLAADGAPPLTLDPERGPTTIEHQYLIVLALHLLNPGNLTARSIARHRQRAARMVRAAAPHARDVAAGLLLRRPREPRPGCGVAARSRWRDACCFLDTRPLHPMLLEQHAMVEQKLRGTSRCRAGPRRRFEQIGLYAKLAALADPEFRPFPRRGERAPASGEIEAIVGFSRITGFLREEER